MNAPMRLLALVLVVAWEEEKRATPSPASLTLAPGPTVDFGSHAVGTEALATVTATNVGGSRASALAADALATPFSFAGGAYPGTGGTCGAEIEGGAACSLVLAHRPETTGAHEATLVLGYHDGTAARTVTVALTGSGFVLVPAAALGFWGGPSYDFGVHEVSTSSSATVTVLNTGTAPATALAAGALPAPFSFAGGPYPGTGGTCGATLDAASGCTLSLVFAPTALGLFGADLDLAYHGGATTRIARLSLTGTATRPPTALLLVEPAAHDFGQVMLGNTPTQAFTLTNQGSAPATSLVPGGLGAPFAWAGGSCASTLDADGSSCAFAVQFAPTALGDFSATLAVGYDDGSTARTVSLPLAGHGWMPPGTLDVSFGDGGVVTTPMGSGWVDPLTVWALTAQGDKLLALGRTDFDRLLLARYRADGALDTTFGSDGWVHLPHASRGFSLALPGDKIVTVGAVAGDFLVLRLDAGGAFDDTFGNGGMVRTDFGGADWAYAVAVQTDGKIVAAGAGDNDFALARYNPDGTLDLSFGSEGKARRNMTTTGGADFADTVWAVALQQNGKIVVSGQRATAADEGDPPWIVARFNANGKALDGTFGTAGVLSLTGIQSAPALYIEPDDRIVVAGSAPSAGGFALARLTADGSFDSTFDGDGRVTTAMDDFAEAWALAVQPDGKVVLSGWSYTSYTSTYRVASARYGRDGRLDGDADSDPWVVFGTGGRVKTPVGPEAVAYAVTVQPDGKVAAGGYSCNAIPECDFLVVRYLADGSLDTDSDGSTGFSQDGVEVTAARDVDGIGLDVVVSVALQGDKLIAAGYSETGWSYDFSLARYLPSGALDLTFGAAGTVLTPVGGLNDYLFDALVVDGGKIVAAGASYTDGSTSDVALVRYLPDGALDPSFGNGGTRTIDIGVTLPDGSVIADAWGEALARQGSKILVGGSAAGDVVVLRLLDDGSLDTDADSGFDPVERDGVVITDLGGRAETRALAVQEDGKIVAAVSSVDAVLIRYLPDGALDGGFGAGGVVVFSMRRSELREVVVYEGVVYAAGCAQGVTSDLLLVAYDASDGSPVAGFGSGGYVFTDLGGSDECANALLVQHGSLTVAGATNRGAGPENVVLARYTLPGGGLDTSFGTGGTVVLEQSALWDRASDALLQADGRIVLGGFTFTGQHGYDFLLARFWP